MRTGNGSSQTPTRDFRSPSMSDPDDYFPAGNNGDQDHDIEQPNNNPFHQLSTPDQPPRDRSSWCLRLVLLAAVGIVGTVLLVAGAVRDKKAEWVAGLSIDTLLLAVTAYLGCKSKSATASSSDSKEMQVKTSVVDNPHSFTTNIGVTTNTASATTSTNAATDSNSPQPSSPRSLTQSVHSGDVPNPNLSNTDSSNPYIPISNAL